MALASAIRKLRSTALRDAHVVVLKASRLAIAENSTISLKVASQPEHRRDILLKETLSKDPEFQRRSARLQKSAPAIAVLPWKDLTKNDVSIAWKRSLRRPIKPRKRLDPNLRRLHVTNGADGLVVCACRSRHSK